MWIRDALESDVSSLTELTGRPRAVVLDLIHDRSVRVAVAGVEGEGDPNDGEGSESAVTGSEVTESAVTGSEVASETGMAESEIASTVGEPSENDDVIGFLAFDARSETVHVTDFGGTERAVTRLLDEPRRFGVGEGMDVEVVVPDAEKRWIETIEDAGFVAVEPGPRFDGRNTTRFRLEMDGDGDTD